MCSGGSIYYYSSSEHLHQSYPPAAYNISDTLNAFGTNNSTQFQIQRALMVYNSLNGLVPEYLSSKFVKRDETHYSLRDSVNKLFVPFPRTNFMKKSFSYSGAVLWNSLPCNVREAKSLTQFKRLVSLHF